MTLDITAIILGVGTFVSTVTLGFLQYRLWKAQAKESESKAQTGLIDAALKISEREVSVLRQVNDDLRSELQVERDRREKSEKAEEQKQEMIDRIRDKLRQYEDTSPLRKQEGEKKDG